MQGVLMCLYTRFLVVRFMQRTVMCNFLKPSCDISALSMDLHNIKMVQDDFALKTLVVNSSFRPEVNLNAKIRF